LTHTRTSISRNSRRTATPCSTRARRWSEHAPRIGTGPGPEKLDSALPFAEQHDWIYATVGIHPHEAKEATAEHLEELARMAQHPKVIAWGEIGLDYCYDHSPREAQARVFRDQMALARCAKKPSSFIAATRGQIA